MKELTLVIPAKNEAECLPEVLNELKNFGNAILIDRVKAPMKMQVVIGSKKQPSAIFLNM